MSFAVLQSTRHVYCCRRALSCVRPPGLAARHASGAGFTVHATAALRPKLRARSGVLQPLVTHTSAAARDMRVLDQGLVVGGSSNSTTLQDCISSFNAVVGRHPWLSPVKQVSNPRSRSGTLQEGLRKWARSIGKAFTSSHAWDPAAPWYLGWDEDVVGWADERLAQGKSITNDALWEFLWVSGKLQNMALPDTQGMSLSAVKEKYHIDHVIPSAYHGPEHPVNKVIMPQHDNQHHGSFITVDKVCCVSPKVAIEVLQFGASVSDRA